MDTSGYYLSFNTLTDAQAFLDSLTVVYDETTGAYAVVVRD